MAVSCLSRCPSNKKPSSAITSLVICRGNAVVVVGGKDGSIHGMAISPNGTSVDHEWSKTSREMGTEVVAMDASIDGKVR